MWRVRRLLLAGLALAAALAGACARPSIVVSGRVLGHDGKPLRRAVVRVGIAGRDQIAVLEGERFAVVLDRPGGYFLWFQGVLHEEISVPVLIEKPGTVEMEVRLRPARWRERIEAPRVIGEFNAFDVSTGAIPMERQADGTYAATVAPKRGAVAYQITGLLDGWQPVEGLQADDYAYNDRVFPRPFVSVLRTMVPARIVFDPRQLPRSTALPEIRFADPEGRAARIMAATLEHARSLEAELEAERAHVEAGGDPDLFDYDWSRDGAKLEAKIDRERDPVIRGFLALLYFWLPLDHYDAGLAAKVLGEISPASPLWSFSPAFDTVAGASPDMAAAERYARRMAGEHPDRKVQADALFFLVNAASAAGRPQDAEPALQRLITEFADDPIAQQAREQIAAGRPILAGRPIPDFSIPSLDLPGRFITRESLKGRTYLMDFWTTHCGVCIADFPRLRRLHDLYRDRGFTIVSLSLDETREEVVAFRKKHGALPWLNGYIDPKLQEHMTVPFGFDGAVPIYILVGEDGIILGSRFEWFAGGLENALARHLGAGAAP